MELARLMEITLVYETDSDNYEFLDCAFYSEEHATEYIELLKKHDPGVKYIYKTVFVETEVPTVSQIWYVKAVWAASSNNTEISSHEMVWWSHSLKPSTYHKMMVHQYPHDAQDYIRVEIVCDTEEEARKIVFEELAKQKVIYNSKLKENA